MRCLVVRFEHHLIRFPVPDGVTTLGSSSESDLVAPFPGISRRHLRVHPVPQGVRLEDLGSKNALSVDGRRCREAELVAGQRVRVGRAWVTLEEGSTSDIELALDVRTGDPNRGEVPGGETAKESDSDSDSGGAPAALRLVRDVEAVRSGGVWYEEAGLLERARNLLGAECLAVFDRQGRDWVDLAVAGSWSSTSDFDPERLAREQGVLLRLPSRGQPGLLARSGAGDAVPPAWKRDLFDYLCAKAAPRKGTRKALRVVADPPEEVATLPGDGFRLPDGMVVGSSVAMSALVAQLRSIAPNPIDVLLLGESGTGKELVARLLHLNGPTPDGPFVAVNCAAIPASLAESEFFGIARGAATDVGTRAGFFASAHGGTLFLDEVGELPEPTQAKLLRALQEREIRPVGHDASRRVDVRVVSASNRDLGEAVRDGKYRADLYYRLRAFEVRLPPLRERREDIAPLALGLLHRISRQLGRPVRGITRRALARLEAHDWPGNVRELESEIRRAVVMAPEGAGLGEGHFGGVGQGSLRTGDDEEKKGRPTPGAERPAPASPARLREVRDVAERANIVEALACCGGNKSRAAKLLGVSRNGLSLKLRRLGIGPLP